MAQGARDTVSLQQPGRLQAVIARELRAFRIERTLTSTLRAAQDYRSQLEVVLQRSNDAIAQVQEGIVVDANAAWLELFGVEEATGLIGQPVMDLFEEATHAPLKGALAACLQGRWSDHTLKAGALLGDGSVVPLELMLALGEYEGEPCVRLIVPARKRDERAARQRTRERGALRSGHRTADCAATCWRRCRSGWRIPIAGGVRCLACVRPDKFAAIERDLGVLCQRGVPDRASPRIVRALLGPNEIAGHFGGATLLLLLERGNERDVEAWSERLVERVAKHLFSRSGGRRAACHLHHRRGRWYRLATPIWTPCGDGLRSSARRGRARGGNQIVVVDRADNDTRVSPTTRSGSSTSRRR